MLFLIQENMVITLANEAPLSIENKNHLYVRIILSINTIENILIENIEFFKYQFFLKLVLYMQPSVDKTPIKPVKRLQTTLSKKVTAELQVCENAADQHSR